LLSWFSLQSGSLEQALRCLIDREADNAGSWAVRASPRLTPSITKVQGLLQ
jgi:hypothetical protein